MRITKRTLFCLLFYGDAEWEVSHYWSCSIWFFYNLEVFFLPSSSVIYKSAKTLTKFFASAFILKYINLRFLLQLSFVDHSCLQGEDSSTCGTGHIQVFLASDSDLENPGDEF